MSSFFIFDPGILKRMGKVIDSKSGKKLEFEVIDEHMKRQNIGFFKQGFCVSIIHFRVYKTNRNFLFKKKTVKITCSCGAPNLDTVNKMGMYKSIVNRFEGSRSENIFLWHEENIAI